MIEHFRRLKIEDAVGEASRLTFPDSRIEPLGSHLKNQEIQRNRQLRTENRQLFLGPKPEGMENSAQGLNRGG
jgi:hypothetical protein